MMPLSQRTRQHGAETIDTQVNSATAIKYALSYRMLFGCNCDAVEFFALVWQKVEVVRSGELV